ncbi:MAG: DUF4268 domain-containing protein [Acidobacteria bacterium]|nr:DUF4268 domain-containing protein [Acidobacteriota bacterium]
MTKNDLRLGELQRVPLESIWPDEAQDFTPWLAHPQNLRILSDTLGLELEPEDEEVPVGPFSADILCRNSADGSWVVIENQIKKTDHTHLGQILTYAAGLEARTLVWVAAKFTEEHRAALDWLNENTRDELSLFGLEIELWRIGDSPPAPKFNVVSKPNDWSKAKRREVEHPGSSHGQFQLEFWTAFKSHLEGRTSLRTQKPAHQNWLNVSIGRAGFHLAAVASTWNTVTESYSSPELRVELVLTSSRAKQRFAKLEEMKNELQSKIDLPLNWYNPEASKSAKVFVRQDSDFMDRSRWPDQFEWLATHLEKFTALFRPVVTQL